MSGKVQNIHFVSTALDTIFFTYSPAQIEKWFILWTIKACVFLLFNERHRIGTWLQIDLILLFPLEDSSLISGLGGISKVPIISI
jgi:hypothetical protein